MFISCAGSLGFGAYSQGQWFFGPWAPSQVHQSIAHKELFPVVIAANLWGSHRSKKQVLFHSDKEAVVALLSSRTSKVPVLMHLLRNLLKILKITVARHEMVGSISPLVSTLHLLSLT